MPTENPAADYYVVNFKGGKESTECTVYASDRSKSCIYKSLKPHTMYIFEYYAGANAPEHDILSEIRHASGRTPPERKLNNNFIQPSKSDSCCGGFCHRNSMVFIVKRGPYQPLLRGALGALTRLNSHNIFD